MKNKFEFFDTICTGQLGETWGDVIRNKKKRRRTR
jgi:hypothetical protein